MSSPPLNSSCSFPTDSAFVVQFCATESGELRFDGRVEHVVSGRTARFASREDLLRFLSDELERLARDDCSRSSW